MFQKILIDYLFYQKCHFFRPQNVSHLTTKYFIRKNTCSTTIPIPENQCLYCVVAHGAILRIYEKSSVISEEIAINYRKANIPERPIEKLQGILAYHRNVIAMESGSLHIVQINFISSSPRSRSK